jgi:nitrite reductase (NADH) large subunit
MSNIIIIGDGIAALSAIKAIREVDPDGEIDLFGEERFYPYYRIKLSKNLLAQINEDAILLQRKDWYVLNKVRLHLNVKVLGIDVKRQEVLLSQDQRLHYDKLLLANGAVNRRLGIADTPNHQAYSIRNWEDVRILQAVLQEKQNILYIGGGVLGLETAWLLKQHHKQVTIVELQNRLFPNQLDERAAAILKNLVESHGIKVLTDTEIVKIMGERTVEAVETRAGLKIPCDLVLYSTGIQPNIEICQGTPIGTNRGVLVDARMQTNVVNVYAAGDVAEYDGKVYGLWSIAAGQGKTAGYNMADRKTFYQPLVPVTLCNAFETSLFSMGDVSEDGVSRTMVEEDLTHNIYRRLFIRGHHIVGAIAIGDNRKSPPLKKAIEQQIPLERFDPENLTINKLLEQIRQKTEQGHQS